MSYTAAFGIGIAFSIALCPTPAANAQAGNRLDVGIVGLRSDNGVVRCGLYNSPAGFRDVGQQFRGVVAPIRNRQATCTFSGIPAGNYAVAVFHAEQNEPQLQTGTFGKPLQGYGFSRNPSSTFGPPSFADAAFDYKGGTVGIQVQLSY
jgi:uncharacterized protein (DUF2141 family)